MPSTQLKMIASFYFILACSLLAGTRALGQTASSATTPDIRTPHRKVRMAFEEIRLHATKLGSGPETIDALYLLSQNAIRKIGNSGPLAVPEINNVLFTSTEDWKVKAMACEALGKINTAESAESLERILADSKQSEFTRAVAGAALAGLARPDAEQVIEKTVSDGSVPIKIRSRIMMAVGQTGLNDVDWLRAVATGSNIGLPKDKQAISQDEFGLILNAQRALGASHNPAAVGVLSELVEKNPSNAVLVEALGASKDRRAIKSLLVALKYESPKGKISTSREIAASALGAIRASEAVEPLIKILEIFLAGRDTLRALEEARTLARARLLEYQQFAAGISTMSPDARMKAAMASPEFKRMQEADAEVSRIQALTFGDANDITLAWRAAEALGNIGDARALPVLQRLLADPRFPNEEPPSEMKAKGYTRENYNARTTSVRKAIERIQGK